MGAAESNSVTKQYMEVRSWEEKRLKRFSKIIMRTTCG